MEHPLARSLVSSAYYSLGNGSLIVPEDKCFCMSWLKTRGSKYENTVANVSQWIAFGISVALLLFYAYEAWTATCGWEEVYVCSVELSKVVIEFFHEFDNPAMLYLAVGTRVQWLRYGEWLLTCPVILIHLSNLTGLKEDYSFRTMRLLVSDIGTIVFGTTSAICTGYSKLFFFLLSCTYGSFTFFNAGKIYLEAYQAVPKGKCQWLVRLNGFIFFFSWTMYPVLFALGPEGLGAISLLGSTIAHTYLDLMSKNAWGLVGHFLRVAVWRHVALHGEHAVMRQSISVNRVDAAKALPGRMSIGGPMGRRMSTGSQAGGIHTSQTGMGAVAPVSTSGITWTSSGDQGTEATANSASIAAGSVRSHFWSATGKSPATVTPAPVPQTVSVKSRANTANGMDKDGYSNSPPSNDVNAASDVRIATAVSAPVATLSAAPAPSPAGLQKIGSAGGWTDTTLPAAAGSQQRRSTSSLERPNNVNSLRLTSAHAPLEAVHDVEVDMEEEEEVPPPAPAAPPADRRGSADAIGFPAVKRGSSTEGLSRPTTSQQRTVPNLTAADI